MLDIIKSLLFLVAILLHVYIVETLLKWVRAFVAGSRNANDLKRLKQCAALDFLYHIVVVLLLLLMLIF